MSLDNCQSKSVLGMLGPPRTAALRFSELLSEDGWAVLGIGLNDLHPLVELYGDAWRDQVLELVAELLLSGRRACGSPSDLLVRLTRETFLVITQASSAVSWEDELRRTFRKGVASAFPPAHLRDGMVCPSPACRLPMSSLAIGIVTDQDGPFSNPRDLLNKVTKARNQNERPALLFDLNSLTVTTCRMREEIQVAEHTPTLLPLIERFAKVTTGPIHDLRNGLSILHEETRKISKELPDAAQGEAIVVATRYSRFLLETCSEIRFRGVGTPHRVNLPELLIENRPLWIQKLDLDATLGAPPEPVHIYADRYQIEQGLFNLLSWLVSREGCKKISVACRSNVDQGEIVITGDFSMAIDSDDLARHSLVELQTAQQPCLYVFQKLVTRYDGGVRLQPGRIVLHFPKYQWQDVRSADTLVEQIRILRAQIEGLRAHLGRIVPDRGVLESVVDLPLKDVIGLGSQVIGDLVDEFSLIRQEAQRQRQKADESQAALWESLEAGSHFCQLLAANLLALEGAHAPPLCATDVAGVLESVRRMLRSRIESIAELEWNVEANLPLVKATEAALAQVVMNLALNSLEELARSRPPISRLSFAARRVPGGVKIDISDTGGGLPTEVMDQLFEPTVSTHQHVEGGIGLYVVKSILDELGGEIELRSPVGMGTAASITLPVWDDSQ